MRTTVYHNMRLFDGRLPYLQDGKMVVVRGDTIDVVEDSVMLPRHTDCKYVDMHGTTLLPGLIDCHVQIGIPFIRKVNFRAIMQFQDQIHNNLRWALESGVTTVRDMAGFPGVIQKMRRDVNSGKVRGPRIFCANSFIGCPGGYPDMAPHMNPVQRLLMGGQFAERVSNPAEARDCVRRMVDLGADWIKSGHAENSYFAGRPGKLPNPSDDTYRALVDEAHRLDRPVAFHQTWLTGFQKGVDLGVQSLEHLPADGEIPDELVDRVVRQGMFVVPTMHVPNTYLELEDAGRFLKGKGKDVLAPEPYRQTKRLYELLCKKGKTEEDLARDCLIDVNALREARDSGLLFRNLRKLHEAGVVLGCGSDGGGELVFFGEIHKEMRQFVRAGLSNFEALQAATLNNARILGKSHRLGSIEPGKTADLVAVQGNPLEDIECLADVSMVVKDGVMEVRKPVLEPELVGQPW